MHRYMSPGATDHFYTTDWDELGTGNYGYYIDHDGDGTEGNCIYSCNGDIRQAPYELGMRGGKATAHVDMENGHPP